MERSTVIDRIATLAAERNLIGAYNLWNHSRQNCPSGTAYIHNRSMVADGNGLFWTESDRIEGMVYLWRPGRVVTALEVRAEVAFAGPCPVQ